jgi:hypothetical protein
MVQVPEDLRDVLVSDITQVVDSTSQSNLPAIYGMVAAAEVKRLRPQGTEDTVNFSPVCFMSHFHALL